MTIPDDYGWKRFARTGATLAGALALIGGVGVGGAQARKSVAHSRALPLEAARLIVEYNSSAQDIGVQAFLDSEGWRDVEIFDPRGTKIFEAEASGRLLQQGGGTELFLESVEPGLDELPVEEFLKRFPAGEYRFRGHSPEGDRLTATAKFSHVIPDGPMVTAPTAPGGACPSGVAIPTVISWNPVTTAIDGGPAEIVRYEVIVENESAGLNFDVIAPAAVGTQVTVPMEILEPDTDYIFEVLAIEKGGNQTITEGCFRSAS